MSVYDEMEYMDVSLEKNDMITTTSSFKKIFHVNRTPTPVKPTRHWCMSTELLRSQYNMSNKKTRVYNPFNENLVQRLSEATYSPTVLVNAVSPSQVNEFGWNIDDVSKLNPAHIEDEFVVDEDQVDDETESKLQETIDKYFNSTHKVLSPWNNQVTDWETCESMSSSTNISVRKKSKSMTYSREVSTQTSLSFPSVLPDHIEEILKPYFMNSTHNDEGDISPTKDTSTLRRKLFFINDNDDPISPVKLQRNLSVSPLTRGFNYTASSKGPVLGNHLGIQELPKDCHPVDVSPIIKIDKENTPPKDKTGDFIFTTPVSMTSRPKRRRTEKCSLMESSSDTGYQTMSIKETSSLTSFGLSSKDILFTASTPS